MEVIALASGEPQKTLKQGTVVDLGFRDEVSTEKKKIKKLDVQRYQGREEWGVTREPEVVG